jgi:hypothetical protein
MYKHKASVVVHATSASNLTIKRFSGWMAIFSGWSADGQLSPKLQQIASQVQQMSTVQHFSGPSQSFSLTVPPQDARMHAHHRFQLMASHLQRMECNLQRLFSRCSAESITSADGQPSPAGKVQIPIGPGRPCACTKNISNCMERRIWYLLSWP